MVRMQVLIKKVRLLNFATVELLNKRGRLVPSERTRSIKFPDRYAGAFEEGSVWEVAGESRECTYRIADRTITEDLVIAQHAVKICPKGPAIAFWLEKNVPGIGKVTAQKLARAFKNLNQVIRDGDIEALCTIEGMSVKQAQELVARWPDGRIYSEMRFLSDCGLPAKLAEPITRIYKSRTEELIKADPYLLVSLGVPFADVDALIERLGLTISEDDRNVAIAEEATHRKSMTGPTVVRAAEIEAFAKKMGHTISEFAIDEAVKRGALIKVEDGYQTIGMARMEVVVCHRIACYASRKPGEAALLAAWERTITEEAVKAKLRTYEREELGFELTDEQRSAVIGSLLSPVACITGGAGVGKTTILKAVLGVYSAFKPKGASVHLLALSGRAAQRISRSTGYEAKTIAKHIFDNWRGTEPHADEHTLVVIDEASMIDLHTMYRLTKALPKSTRLLLVGDVAQLPPVGPGLIFHDLVKSGIPTFNLYAVQRQAADSGIHRFATSVREGLKPQLPKLEDCLKTSPDFCHSNDLDLEHIQNLWHEAGRAEHCIIIAPTNTGEFGVDSINAHIQGFIGTDRPILRHLDMTGWIPWKIKGRSLHLGDQVMVTANDYQNHMRNGDLATIIKVYDQPTDNGEYGILELEGELIPINDDVINKLDLGFCITIHKSQGSQWPVAIMILSKEGGIMTDRSLLYTGATRPQKQLLILGPEAFIRRAISRGNFADQRRVAIRELLTSYSGEYKAIAS